MLGREDGGPELTVGVEASGPEQAVWVGIDWGLHQCRPCTPLLRGLGSQSPRGLGPWAELWPQKGGQREESDWTEVWGAGRRAVASSVALSAGGDSGMWPLSPLNPGAPTLIPGGPPGGGRVQVRRVSGRRHPWLHTCLLVPGRGD